MSLRIEAFTRDSQSQVTALVLGIQRDEFGIAITAEEQPDLIDIPNFVQKGAGNFWVALSGETVVGTIALLDRGGGLGALRKMFVAIDWRGREKRVESTLLETLLAHARAHGLQEIVLGTTEAYHAAHRFYEKTGFTEIPAEALPAAFPRIKQDSKFYRLRL